MIDFHQTIYRRCIYLFSGLDRLSNNFKFQPTIPRRKKPRRKDFFHKDHWQSLHPKRCPRQQSLLSLPNLHPGRQRYIPILLQAVLQKDEQYSLRQIRPLTWRELHVSSSNPWRSNKNLEMEMGLPRLQGTMVEYGVSLMLFNLDYGGGSIQAMDGPGIAIGRFPGH